MDARSLYFLRLFDGQNSRKTHNITQIHVASLLAVATVFIGLWTLISTLIFTVREGRGLLLCETKLPVQELELKVQGGAYVRRGRNCGILWYNTIMVAINCLNR